MKDTNETIGIEIDVDEDIFVKNVRLPGQAETPAPGDARARNADPEDTAGSIELPPGDVSMDSAMAGIAATENDPENDTDIEKAANEICDDIFNDDGFFDFDFEGSEED